jgi:LysM repeat protein
VRTTNLIAALTALALLAAGAPASAQDDAAKQPEAKGGEQQPETKAAETRSVALLQAREVIERLKTMRAQLLLEQEYNRLLEVRVERMELEAKLGGSIGRDGKATPSAAAAKAPDGIGANQPPPARAHIAPPPKLENAADALVVKAVTVAPFKEAIVTYRGRVYTVRPGDKLGNIEIRDILDSGVVTAGGGQKSSVMLGQ